MSLGALFRVAISVSCRRSLSSSTLHLRMCKYQEEKVGRRSRLRLGQFKQLTYLAHLCRSLSLFCLLFHISSVSSSIFSISINSPPPWVLFYHFFLNETYSPSHWDVALHLFASVGVCGRLQKTLKICKTKKAKKHTFSHRGHSWPRHARSRAQDRQPFQGWPPWVLELHSERCGRNSVEGGSLPKY